MREGTLIFTGDKALTKKKKQTKRKEKEKKKAAFSILNGIRETVFRKCRVLF